MDEAQGVDPDLLPAVERMRAAAGSGFWGPNLFGARYVGWVDRESQIGIVAATNGGDVLIAQHVRAWPPRYVFVDADEGEMRAAWAWLAGRED